MFGNGGEGHGTFGPVTKALDLLFEFPDKRPSLLERAAYTRCPLRFPVDMSMVSKKESSVSSKHQLILPSRVPSLITLETHESVSQIHKTHSNNYALE